MRPRVNPEDEEYEVEQLLLTFVDQGDGTMAASVGGWARDTEDEEVLVASAITQQWLIS